MPSPAVGAELLVDVHDFLNAQKARRVVQAAVHQDLSNFLQSLTGRALHQLRPHHRRVDSTGLREAPELFIEASDHGIIKSKSSL